MTITTKTELYIESDPVVVYEHLVDLECHQKWNPHLTEISPLTRLKPGMYYRTKSRVLGREMSSNNHVTSMVSPEELTIENDAGPIHYRIEYRLSAADGGCQLSCHCHIESTSAVFKIAAGLAQSIAEDKITADLKTLKVLVEETKTGA